MDRSLNTERGFTLIELLVSMAISAIVLGGVAASFVSQSRSYDAQAAVNEMHQRARVAMDMMTRDIRMAGYNPTGANFVKVNKPEPRHIKLKADLNGDGDTDDTYEFISYKYKNSEKKIERKDGDDPAVFETFLEQIEDLTFDTLDKDGNVTAVSADIRLIQITITARTAKRDPNYPLNDGFRTYTLKSLVSPRNL